MRSATSLHRIAMAGLVALTVCGTAHAIDCWVPTLDQATTGYGDKITSPRHANILAKMRKAESLFRNERPLLDLPGVRLQVKNFIGLPVSDSGHTYATVTVGMHRPKVWGAGCTLNQKQADYVVPIEFGANFNDIAPVVRLLDSPSSVQEAGYFPAPEKTGETQGFPIYGNRVLVLTPPGQPLFVPHRVQDHLDHWERLILDMQKEAPGDPLLKGQLDGLRSHKAKLSAGQLAAQVALGASDSPAGSMWAYSTIGAASTSPMVRINSKLWRPKSGEGQLRLLILSAWVNNEDDPLVGAAQGWVGSIDAKKWSELLDQ